MEDLRRHEYVHDPTPDLSHYARHEHTPDVATQPGFTSLSGMRMDARGRWQSNSPLVIVDEAAQIDLETFRRSIVPVLTATEIAAMASGLQTCERCYKQCEMLHHHDGCDHKLCKTCFERSLWQDACLVCKRTHCFTCKNDEVSLELKTCDHYNCDRCTPFATRDIACATCAHRRPGAPFVASLPGPAPGSALAIATFNNDHKCMGCQRRLDPQPALHTIVMPCQHTLCQSCSRAMLLEARFVNSEPTCAHCKGPAEMVRSFQWTPWSHPDLDAAPPSSRPAAAPLEVASAAQSWTAVDREISITAVPGASSGIVTITENLPRAASGAGSSEEQPHVMSSSSSAESRKEVPAAPTTLEELKLASLPEGNTDWTCMVCCAPYDNGKRVPMRVTQCYAQPVDPENYLVDEWEFKADKKARGKAPGCDHRSVICQWCVGELEKTYESNTCPLCRKWIRRTAPDLELLTEIISRHGGEYLALVRQLNDMGDQLGPLGEQIFKLQKKNADQKKLLDQRQDSIEKILKLERSVIKAQQETSSFKQKLEQAEKDVAVLRKFRDDKLKAERLLSERDKICTFLYEELIDSRLAAVHAGSLTADQLGIEVDKDAVNMYVVTLGNRHRLQYVRPRTGFFRRNDQERLATVRKLTAAINSNAVSLPTEEELAQSHWTVPAPNGIAGDCVTLVKTGSWLHCWLRRNMAAEALFDAPASAPQMDLSMDTRYVPIPQPMLDHATRAYAKLKTAAATTARATIAADASNDNEEDVPMPLPGCCVGCFKTEAVAKCSKCGFHWCTRGDHCGHGCSMNAHKLGACGEAAEFINYVAWAERLFTALYLVQNHGKVRSPRLLAAALMDRKLIDDTLDLESFTSYRQVTAQMRPDLQLCGETLLLRCPELVKQVLACVEKNERAGGVDLPPLDTSLQASNDKCVKAASTIKNLLGKPLDEADEEWKRLGVDPHELMMTRMDLTASPTYATIVKALQFLERCPRACSKPVTSANVREWAKALLKELGAPAAAVATAVAAQGLRCICCLRDDAPSVETCDLCNYPWCGTCPHWCRTKPNDAERGKYGECQRPYLGYVPYWFWACRLLQFLSFGTVQLYQPPIGHDDDHVRDDFWAYEQKVHHLPSTAGPCPASIDAICAEVLRYRGAYCVLVWDTVAEVQAYCYSLVDRFLRTRSGEGARPSPDRINGPFRTPSVFIAGASRIPVESIGAKQLSVIMDSNDGDIIGGLPSVALVAEDPPATIPFSAPPPPAVAEKEAATLDVPIVTTGDTRFVYCPPPPPATAATRSRPPTARGGGGTRSASRRTTRIDLHALFDVKDESGDK